MRSGQTKQLENSLFTIGLVKVLLVLGTILLFQFRLWVPAGIIMLILITTETGRWWSRAGLTKIEIKKGFYPQRVFAGETTRLRIRLSNPKLLPVIIDWEQEALTGPRLPASSAQASAKNLAFTTIIKWFGTHSAEYEVKAEQRGCFRLPPSRIVSSDGAGFYSTMLTVNDEQWLMVYPRIVALPELGIKASDLIGEKADQRTILPDPIRIMGLREYTPDLPSRLIDWKASAHKDVLMAKMLEPSAEYKICMAVDVLALQAINTDGAETFEKCLSLAASIAAWAEEEGIPFGLLVNAAQTNLTGPVYVPIGNGFSQMALVLEKLARLEFNPLGSLEDLLVGEGASIPWGTALVIIGPTTLTGLSGGVRQRVDIPVIKEL